MPGFKFGNSGSLSDERLLQLIEWINRYTKSDIARSYAFDATMRKFGTVEDIASAFQELHMLRSQHVKTNEVVDSLMTSLHNDGMSMEHMCERCGYLYTEDECWNCKTMCLACSSDLEADQYIQSIAESDYGSIEDEEITYDDFWDFVVNTPHGLPWGI